LIRSSIRSKKGGRVISGRALIVAGGKHMAIKHGEYHIEIVDGPPV
jgi:chemotaxis response regulator CheB